MVNTGGPSKGCRTCIERKIRCDGGRPACGKCLKSKRLCGGYRNAIDRLFRDETQAVVAKLASPAPTHAKSTASTITSDENRKPSSEHSLQRPRTSLDAIALFNTLKLDEEKGLVDFFANNFTCSGLSVNRSNLFWVPSNFVDLLKENVTHISVKCVGAMALARLQRSAYYLREAQRMYSTAIISLSKRWREGKPSNEEGTFITILFLAFFEVLACWGPLTQQSWITHIGGIGALFQTCSGRFLATDFSAKMLLQSRSQAILYALQMKTPVTGLFAGAVPPPIRLAMPAHMKPAGDLDILLIRLAELQACTRLTVSPPDLFSRLLALDVDLSHWPINLPPSWSFSKQNCKSPVQYWWEVRHDTYSSLLIMNIWNKYRAARIILHDLIRETSSRVTLSLHQPQTQRAISSFQTEQLVVDLCATVPIYYRPSTSRAILSREVNKPLLGTTYWLLWVLEVVGSMREAPFELIVWVTQCFERIHEATGIAVAQRAAGRLRNRKRSIP